MSDLFSFHIRKYDESGWGYRYLGPKRHAFDVYKIGFIFEFWWIRE